MFGLLQYQCKGPGQIVKNPTLSQNKFKSTFTTVWFDTNMTLTHHTTDLPHPTSPSNSSPDLQRYQTVQTNPILDNYLRLFQTTILSEYLRQLSLTILENYVGIS